ncbi:hypothetical protein AVEN_144789-1 [Araneus ventricosus]|uniref:Uncharacterized protein n=1 Tax=Araneus ventricosus TaxID=182803 RepID=A0A4Y2MAP8_ARAVE|nr:hypothetical protein AVEN_144789-1 [Araneus ventricosus]
MEKNKSKPPTIKDLNRIRGIIKTKLTNIQKFAQTCSTIDDQRKIVISAQQKLNSVKVMKEEFETLFKQYLDIEEDEKSSKKWEEDMLELLEERDEIEERLKCLFSNAVIVKSKSLKTEVIRIHI